jgi:hypothetical protein
MLGVSLTMLAKEMMRATVNSAKAMMCEIYLEVFNPS